MAGSVLKTVQQEVSAELIADPFFSGNNIPVLTENVADIQYEISKAIGEIGMVCLVLTPNASTTSPSSLNIYFDSVQILVRIIEDPIVWTSNSTVTAADAAEVIVGILHTFQPGGGNETIWANQPTITLVPNTDFLYIYDVKFSMSLGAVYVRNTVVTPIITTGTNSFTLTCATPGAATFYAYGQNGWPTPQVGTLYLGQVSGVTSGTIIQARSWLAGYIASSTATVVMP